MAIAWHRHYGDACKARSKKKLTDHHKPLDAILMADDMTSQILEHAADAESVAHVEYAVSVESAERVAIAENVVHLSVVDMVNAAKILGAGAVGEALEGSTKIQ